MYVTEEGVENKYLFTKIPKLLDIVFSGFVKLLLLSLNVISMQYISGLSIDVYFSIGNTISETFSQKDYILYVGGYGKLKGKNPIEHEKC